MGKRDSRRHSTTYFGQNVVVEETSYQMFEVLSFYAWKRALPFFNKNNHANFSREKKKSSLELSGMSTIF